jgi:hypothetical protein
MRKIQPIKKEKTRALAWLQYSTNLVSNIKVGTYTEGKI